MADRKPPRRTRARILETSLALFNRDGEPHTTTADIADEMNISPGNLYYHFRNKDDIIGELYSAYEVSVLPLLVTPQDPPPPHVEDLWLMLHLLFERMRDYRFLFRDLDEITSRNRRISVRFGELARRGERTVIELCGSLVSTGQMVASTREIAAVASNVALVSTYWMSWQRISGARAEKGIESNLDHAAYQVLALIAPFLIGDGRALIERLGADYL